MLAIELSYWRDEIIAGYTSTDAADEELFCIPRRGGGAYLSRILIESCMIDALVLRFTGSAAFNGYPEHIRHAEMSDWLGEHLLPVLTRLTPESRHVFGMDFARTGDLSVIAPMQISQTLHRTCPFLLEMNNVPHLQQVQALCYICDRLPRFTGGAIDAGGNGSFIAEAALDRYGSLVEGIKFSESWYREQMPKYKAGFEDGTISIPKNDDVLQDHRALRLVRGVPRLPPGKTDRAGTRHGDSAIALALAFYAANQDKGPIEFAASGARETAGLNDAYLGGMDNMRGYI